MSSWRDAILKDFVPNVSKLTLVADPDGLLTEEKLVIALRERGFDLVEFTDPVEFRYVYESKYRAIWDRGEHTDLIVILRVQDRELEGLPYDLLQAGRKLSFNLGALFPNLSYPVIEKLDRSLLDAIYEAQRKSSPDRMGDNATKDFVLRHAFGIAAELITTDVELLRALLRLHYATATMPAILADRLVQVLSGNFVASSSSGTEQPSLSGEADASSVGQKAAGACSAKWPLADIVPDGEAFFAFLQERWPVFLDGVSAKGEVREESEEYGLQYPGPAALPFDHQDIRVYIDNLFLEGKLTPVAKPGVDVKKQSWMRSGIADTSAQDQALRLEKLFDLVAQDQPTVESRHLDWIAFALKWAELSALVHTQNSRSFAFIRGSKICNLQSAINNAFRGWLEQNYAGLINLPPTTPAMVHHVPRHMARVLEDADTARTALIVVDGLALDQWVTLRQVIQEQDTHLVMRETAAFAWIPTLTSVSRQAIFSGKPPLYFPSSIATTNSENNLWRQFWESAGLSRLDVAYKRGLGSGDVEVALEDTIHPTRTRAAGVVVDTVDKIMHGMQLGAAGMHNQIRQWAHEGFLLNLATYLLDYGFDVWLTSDHGNIECRGAGRPSEGVVADTRGERARIYPSPELRQGVAENFPAAVEWQQIGLPAEFFPLLADGEDAFIKPGETTVAHGGIAIEEVLVPLVRFERRSRHG